MVFRACTYKEAPYLKKFLKRKVKSDSIKPSAVVVIHLSILAIGFISILLHIIAVGTDTFLLGTSILLGVIVGFIPCGIVIIGYAWYHIRNARQTYELIRNINNLNFYIEEGCIVDKHYYTMAEWEENLNISSGETYNTGYYIEFELQDGSKELYKVEKREWDTVKILTTAWRIELCRKYYLLFGNELEKVLKNT